MESISNLIFLIILSFSISFVKSNYGDYRDKNMLCNIALVENNCQRGYAFCRYDDRETCSNCKVGTILSQPYKNTYKCVKKDMTLCKDDDCVNCDDKGDCLKCKDTNNISYDGKCVKKTNEIKCLSDNCISCKNSGNICVFCSENYSLESGSRCVENRDGCSLTIFNENDITCVDCHNNYVMNYDFKGCRKLPDP